MQTDGEGQRDLHGKFEPIIREAIPRRTMPLRSVTDSALFGTRGSTVKKPLKMFSFIKKKNLNELLSLIEVRCRKLISQ